jgi:hypothetical protein
MRPERLPPYLGSSRMDFDGAGVAFIIWTHRTVLDGGKRVVACMLIWRFPDGTKGRRPCGGIVQATEDASRVVAMSACSEQRTS